MSKKDFQVTNYIDDIVGQATPFQADSSFEAISSLLSELGLDISAKKLIYPTTRASCVGVTIDTTDFTISVPQDKLGDIQKECHRWAQIVKACALHELCL